jgi:hypothetical protein
MSIEKIEYRFEAYKKFIEVRDHDGNPNAVWLEVQAGNVKRPFYVVISNEREAKEYTREHICEYDCLVLAKYDVVCHEDSQRILARRLRAEHQADLTLALQQSEYIKCIKVKKTVTKTGTKSFSYTAVFKEGVQDADGKCIYERVVRKKATTFYPRAYLYGHQATSNKKGLGRLFTFGGANSWSKGDTKLIFCTEVTEDKLDNELNGECLLTKAFYEERSPEED